MILGSKHVGSDFKCFNVKKKNYLCALVGVLIKENTNSQLEWAVPRFRRLVAGLSLCKPGFDPRLYHVDSGEQNQTGSHLQSAPCTCLPCQYHSLNYHRRYIILTMDGGVKSIGHFTKNAY